jgi:hypothetical protein
VKLGASHFPLSPHTRAFFAFFFALLFFLGKAIAEEPLVAS